MECKYSHAQINKTDVRSEFFLLHIDVALNYTLCKYKFLYEYSFFFQSIEDSNDLQNSPISSDEVSDDCVFKREFFPVPPLVKDCQFGVPVLKLYTIRFQFTPSHVSSEYLAESYFK